MCGSAQAGQGAHTNGLSWLVVLDWLEIGKSIQNHNLRETLFFYCLKIYTLLLWSTGKQHTIHWTQFLPTGKYELLLIIDIILYRKLLKMHVLFDKNAYCKVLKCLL